MEVEIGRGKKARRAYGFDDIAIVPSRRTRDPDDVDITWKLGDYRFELPLLASAMDGVVSPATAGIIGRLGGLAVLNLEGIFTRYEDAEEQLERIAGLPKELATREMQRIYAEPVKEELIAPADPRDQGGGRGLRRGSLTPQRVSRYYEIALDAGLDILVIQGTVVSGEHVSTHTEPLNLKEFIPELDVPVVVGGCASYHTGLHLMRTGAAGGPRRRRPGCGLHDARRARDRRAAGDGDRRRRGGALDAHARDRRLRPGDRRRRHAQRRRRREGDRLRRRRGDDRLAAGARATRRPGAASTGAWRRSIRRCRAARASRRTRTRRSRRSSSGPARENDGTLNLFGGLRTSMATCGYKDIAEFNRAELMVAPALQTEGKQLQREQGVGMGSTGKAAVLVND